MGAKGVFAVLGLSIGIAGLLLASRANEALAQDKGQKEKTEEKEILFLTPDDSVLAKRLREKGRVELAVVYPYKGQPRVYRLSQFKRVDGITPPEGDYFGENVLLSRKPLSKNDAAGYFPKSMYTGATLRNITAKGACEAVRGASRQLKLTVCGAMLSAYSQKAKNELPDD